MKHFIYFGSLLLLLAFSGALLLLAGPVKPVEPVQLFWADDSAASPALVLLSIQTMEETAFLRVHGRLLNRGVEPIGPIVMRCRFTSRSHNAYMSAMAFPTPESIAPGSTAHFLAAIPAQFNAAFVQIDFRLLTGEPLPLAGNLVANKTGKAP